MIDLDSLKQTNESYGREVGDKIITHVAKLLSTNLRDSDFLARVGGDEFVVMLTNVTSDIHMTEITERLFNVVSKPVQIKQHLIQISVHIGASVYPKNGTDIQTLLLLAESARTLAKEKGKNQYHIYSK